MSVAFLFPGQGSQAVGMGKGIAEAFPEAAAVFARADEILGFSLRKVMWEGPSEELLRTDRTQPAIFTVSMAICEILRGRGIVPSITAGHSVGEYAALAAAGVFDFETGLRLVKARSEAMHASSLESPGGMIALLGMEEDAARIVCEDVHKEKGGLVEVANLNSPGQVVISGEKVALDLAMRLARMRGAVKAVPLSVAGPWHCALMKKAEEALAPVIRSANFSPARVPVVVNVTATALTAPDAIKDALIAQVCGAVRWADSVKTIAASAPGGCIEAGHGTVLGGLMKRIDKTLKVRPASTPEEIGALAAGGV